jgi:hypothetical protein
MTLQRLIISFKPEVIEIRTLYSTKGGHNPGTKARTRVVANLTREGLRQALASLEGRVDVVGTSGFATREDILSAPVSPDADKLVKGGQWT